MEEIPREDVDAVGVSSTRIRQALRQGDMATANRYLGYHYPLTGMVVHGQKLGRTIGYPTANLRVDGAAEAGAGPGHLCGVGHHGGGHAAPGHAQHWGAAHHWHTTWRRPLR